jgi:hypothetical protein
MEPFNSRSLIMIKSVRDVVIFFLFILLCIQSCKNERIKGPAIRFESDTCNFGEAPRGKILSSTFLFFNPGSDTLVLESVRPSCSSCTNIDEYDKRVAPGGRGKIRITYKVAGIPRYIEHKVYVTTNIPDAKDIILVISGQLVKSEAMPEESKQLMKN